MNEWFGASRFPARRFGTVFEVQLGKMLQPNPLTPTDQPTPYLKASSLSTGQALLGDDEMWASETDRRKFAVRQGDLLVVEGGDVGRASVYDGTYAIMQNSLHRVRGTEHGDVRYGMFVLELLRHSGYLDVLCSVATIRHLTGEKLHALEVPVPPLEEQRRIAAFLDDQTTRIDQIITARQQQIEMLAMQWASTLDESYSKHPRATRLARFARVQSGITVDSGRDVAGAEEIPYLRVANVQSGWIDLSEVKTVMASPEQVKRHALGVGDVLMTEGGDLDKLGRGTVWEGQIERVIHQNHVFAVRPDPTRLLPLFLAFYTETSAARLYFESTGNRSTNLASTSASKVLDLPVPVTDIPTQETTVASLCADRDSLSAHKATLRRSIDLLQEFKRSLISAAVSGEFDVSSAGGRGVPS